MQRATEVATTKISLKIVGEAADWSSSLARVPIQRTDMLLVDLDLLPGTPAVALQELREAFPFALVVVLISHLDACQQAALALYVDAFIPKGELSNHVLERVRVAAAGKHLTDKWDLKNQLEEEAQELTVTTS